MGLTEAKARASYDVEAAVVSYADIDRAVIDGHTTGYCKLIVNTENHRILGAHVVGEQALEIVQLVAAGMAADIWVEQLADLEISYPTYTSIVGLAARKLVDLLGVRPVSPEWRAAGGAYAALALASVRPTLPYSGSVKPPCGTSWCRCGCPVPRIAFSAAEIPS